MGITEFQGMSFDETELDELTENVKDYHNWLENYFKGYKRIPTKHERFKAKQEYKKQKEMNTPVLSTVESVTGAGTFENEYGSFNSWEYTMTDGTIIKANHKATSNAFEVGTQVEYVVKRDHPEHGKSGNVRKPQEGGFSNNANRSPQMNDNKTSDRILYQVCLKGVMGYYTHAERSFEPEVFTAENINKLALEIAKTAKQNINNL